MKMADILRDLANKLDSIENGQGPQDKGHLEPVGDVPQGDTDSSVMVAPLQQKLELLKKASGVPSTFDAQGGDELDDIKKLTGINAVMQHEAGEDNDIVG
jgi:hypothetical protein